MIGRGNDEMEMRICVVGLGPGTRHVAGRDTAPRIGDVNMRWLAQLILLGVSGILLVLLYVAATVALR